MAACACASPTGRGPSWLRSSRRSVADRLARRGLSLGQKPHQHFDLLAGKIGQQVGPTTVRHSSDLKSVVEDEDIVVGVLAVPTAAAQPIADDLVEAGVKIIFNYSEALLQTPPHVTVHTSSPAVDLLYALYFYLT